MFGIKTFFKNNIFYPKFLFPKENGKFPEKPVSKLRIEARLQGVLNKLKNQKKYSGIGNLITFPHREAVRAWHKLLPYNPNNLGNWSIKGLEPNQETATIERELICQMVDLYHGDKKNLEGYVTSGGTEGNIFSAWVGRKFLEGKGIKKEKIYLIKTSLTHYSIEKAADIVGVKTFITSLNEGTWGMDVGDFEKSVKDLIKKGYKGFLVSLTLGYTVTGTFDPLEAICHEISKLRKRHKGVEFFVWVDAALNGLIEPFLNDKFRPFTLSEIQTFLVDFHKFGFTPIPAGIILYRKELRQLIEKPIDYLNEKDNTLLGSRSGVAPVACWIIINYLGKLRFKSLILKKKKVMKTFIKKFSNEKNIKLVSYPNSLSLALVIKNKKLAHERLINKYGLHFIATKIKFENNTKDLLMAKVFFL